MTSEDIELRLKDLCARLPYGVKVSLLGGGAMELKSCINSSIGWYADMDGAPTDFGVDEIKPYLRPMSSMTEEEKDIFQGFIYPACNDPVSMIDWLNSHHFDYRGLIEKGLALEAPEGMYKF